MKYITTDKHPELKEGIVLKGNGHQYECRLGYKIFFAGQPCIDEWLNNEFIKIVQEKEFTKSDMNDYGKFRAGFADEPNDDIEKLFINDWLKQRK